MSLQQPNLDVLEHAFVASCGRVLDPNTTAVEPNTPLVLGATSAEDEFYNAYSWCLNAFPTFAEVIIHLSEELHKFAGVQAHWQESELITNIFLLSCSLTDSIDDFVAGSTYDFAKLRRALPRAAPAIGAIEQVLRATGRLRIARFVRLQQWRRLWASAVTDFLQHSAVAPGFDKATLLPYLNRLASLLGADFPRPLLKQRCKLPAFFRSRDFAPQDCLELGRKFIETTAGSDRPVIIMGLRTAGSFLAPLLCAYFRSKSMHADWVAVRPKKGLSAWERTPLEKAARAKARALIIDESIHSGETLAKAVGLLHQAGFSSKDAVVLNPVEPAFPHWKNSSALATLSEVTIITLEPAERYKQRWLDSAATPELITSYFKSCGYTSAQLVNDSETEELNRRWRSEPPERVDVRLKRVYRFRLQDSAGATEIRYILAKSVGWGWLGYHAFVAGRKLANFVAPILGLRDGILFMEWFPQAEDHLDPLPARQELIAFLGSYVAARTQSLGLFSDPSADLVPDRRHKGFDILASFLTRAYGSRIVAALKRSAIQRQLACQTCPTSVLTDSKMSREELITDGHRLVKADFEHHGQGKNELGMTDPAYDLAGAIFHLQLSDEESAELVRTYVIASGDTRVDERLFLNKLLAAFWAQAVATLGLHNSQLFSHRQEFHKSYISAWNFLVKETIRECAKLCQPAQKIEWRGPLVVVDIDGVLDRMVFGFPCSTAAGIKALSLLHSHGVTVAVNTARTLQEVRQYCRSYGMAGGVAEYGGVIWDAVSGRELVLVSPESLQQLGQVQRALQEIPGIFVNEDYKYSLRAFTYQSGRTVPLPSLLVQDLLAKVKADRLSVHHTGLDTAIVAKETNKGNGLLALLTLVGLPASDTVAIGDSEPDLAMFRVAGRSFAPGNITCRREATSLGCNIAESLYQRGLLHSVRQIVHPDGGTCMNCKLVDEKWPSPGSSLFSDLLVAADQKPLPLLLRNLFSSSPLAIFRT